MTNSKGVIIIKLRNVLIENYKSIISTEPFNVDPVTCLVGKNESGKSAVLQALYKLNPTENDEKFVIIDEYPRNHFTKKEEEHQKENILTTAWELEEPELDAIKEMFGENALDKSEVTLKKGYDNKYYWDIPANIGKIINHFLMKFEHTSMNTREFMTVEEFKAKLTETNEADKFTALLEDIDRKIPEGNVKNAIAQILTKYLPKFVYFPEYEKLPGKVSISELKMKVANKTIGFQDKLILALFALIGTTPEEIDGLGTLEHLIAKLEALSNRISKEIFSYWSQNKYLEVQFRFDHGRPGDTPPFNNGYVFMIRIRNSRHGVTVSFDERSTGFVWFFSFLVWFSQVKETYGEKLILLLDEPGLSLHGKAQGDLLRYISEQLKPDYQVIYSTHSPFMVDPENLLSVRTVEDKVQDEQVLGTKVGDKVLSTDSDTIFPLQAALGYDVTQSLFVGTNNLLVEGPSDLLYLKWASEQLRNQKRTFLDSRWTIVPSGGIEKISSFISLFSGKKLSIAVFSDYHKEIKTKIRRLRESELLKAGHVYSAEMFTEQDEADVEDMFGKKFYIELVNRCFNLSGENNLKTSDFPQNNRIVKGIEERFSSMPLEIDDFNHYKPAEYLIVNVVNPSDLPGGADALERFERLFGELNKLLD